MKTSRLEAFSDGVIAIIITIMVLELKFRMPQAGLRYPVYCLNSFVISSALSMSASTGTITIICCITVAVLMAELCGVICFSYSGFL